MSDETKKEESAIEESDAQSELSDEQIEDVAGGAIYMKYADIQGDVETHAEPEDLTIVDPQGDETRTSPTGAMHHDNWRENT